MTITRLVSFEAFLASDKGKALIALFNSTYQTDWYESPEPEKQMMISEVCKTIYRGLWAQFVDQTILNSLEEFRNVFLPLLKQETVLTEEALAEAANLLKVQLNMREKLYMSLEHHPSLESVELVWGNLSGLVQCLHAY